MPLSGASSGARAVTSGVRSPQRHVDATPERAVRSSGFALYHRGCHSEMNVTEEGAAYRSSPSAELKLLLRLLSLEAAPGEPAERSGSAPNGESGSSIRISSSRCSSLSVELKKSVKWDSGSEKVVQESAPVT